MKKLLLLLLFIPLLLFSQNTNSVYNDLDKLIEKNIDPSQPGIIANIYSETSDLDWSKSFGINDISKNNLLDKFDQFRIASVTKTFVAATILRLWEEDKINIDDPISKYISKEHYNILIKGNYNPEIIAVRNLLNHSSGLYDHTNHSNFFNKVFENPSYKWTRTEQISACVEWGNPVGITGNQFKYSDTGYVILGGIIENITGLSLDSSMKILLKFEKLKEEFDEKQFLSTELSSIGKKEFGVDIEVFGATDGDIYDPKGKARHARPFKPAILIE